MLPAGDKETQGLWCCTHQHSGPDLSLRKEQKSIKHVKHLGGGLVNGGDDHLVFSVCQRRDELKERERSATVQTRCRLLRMGKGEVWKGESVRREECGGGEGGVTNSHPEAAELG